MSASLCLFHSSIGQGIGLDVEKGELDETVGVSGVPTRIYRHTVSLHESIIASNFLHGGECFAGLDN